MGMSAVSGGISIIGSLIGGGAQQAGYDKGLDLQKEQLDFMKERYDRWKTVYGELQEDMSEYYKNLTGKELAGRDLEQAQKAMQESNAQVREQLAQRGMSGGGLEASLMAQNAFQGATAKAQIRATADQRANEQRMKFLRTGIGQDDRIAEGIGNVRTNMANLEVGKGNAEAAMWGNVTAGVTHMLGGASGTGGCNSSVGGCRG